jgi:very-short-patch-repair endonuclease
MTTGRARQLRRSQTSEEEKLWKCLRAKRMLGVKFRRQHPCGPYFLDFACESLLLAIELDGAGHSEQAGYDAERDEFLRDRGYTVLRFGNDDVVLRLHAVLETVALEIETLRARRALSPTLSPAGRGR